MMSSEDQRVAAYSARHAARPSREPAPVRSPAAPTEPPLKVGAQKVLRRAKGAPKNVFRFLKKNTPARLKRSAALAPAKAALRFYRKYIRKTVPAAPPADPNETWRDGRPDPRDADRLRAEAYRRHQHPSPASTHTPTIAALVLNRDGAHHLRKLLGSIAEHETYPALSLWIVDHGSTDDSRKVIASFRDRLDLHEVVLDTNRSFSVSNNDLARRTNAELLLLLNNDIIFDRPILGALAAHLDDRTVGAVGARLVYPRHHAERGGMQHAGIKFYEDASASFHRPYNLSSRSGITFVPPGAEQMPAATAALLLCRRADYLSVGGLDEAYVYGFEDVDFCLRLMRDRELSTVVAHDVSALHDESGTQNAESGDDVRDRRVANRVVFEARWGQHLRRHIVEDRLEDRRFFVDEALTIAFAVTEDGPDARAGDLFTARELAAALEDEFGVETKMLAATGDWYDLAGVDVLVAMVDRYDPRKVYHRRPGTVLIAWARNWFDRWAEGDGFHDFDLFMVSSRYAAEVMHETYGRRADVLRIGTHPTRFTEGRYDAALAADVCFTGSHWGAKREIENNLRPETIDGSVAIWGAGWEAHPTLGSVARGFLPYGRLPDVYASTRVVIDDANHVTKPWGSTNSRVFDALAAGALVVTNGTRGAAETFGDRLLTYETPEELTRIVNDALHDEPRRKARVDRLRAEVLDRHTYRDRARRFRALLGELPEPRLRIAIKIAAGSHKTKHQWGDYHFALALRRAFLRLGHLVRIDLLYEWNTPAGLMDDVVLVLRGLSRYETNPRQVNLMWNISHPDDVTDDEYESFDHVFIASSRAAAARQHLSVPVTSLLQCTDAALFYPGRDVEAPSEPVLFVGNSRKQHRPIVMDAIEAGLPLAVYGDGWSGIIPDEYVRAKHIPNEALAAFYERAGVVLNDHWPDMRTTGFLSNRLFDAAASGAVIVSDPAAGLSAVFGGEVRTYTTVGELKAIVEAALANPVRTSTLSERVRREHTFERRADAIVEVAEALLSDNP